MAWWQTLSIRNRLLLDKAIRMKCLSAILGIVLFGAASAAVLIPSSSMGSTQCNDDYTYCPSKLLPSVPVMTKCGLLSTSSIENVRAFFFNLSLDTQTVYYEYVSFPQTLCIYYWCQCLGILLQKTLKTEELEFGEPLLIPSGLDPYWHYDNDGEKSCWLWQPVSHACFSCLVGNSVIY